MKASTRQNRRMTSRAAEDVALINRYLGGDVAVFDELVRAHEDRVFGICLRMMGNREAALDAVQETFLTVFRKADRGSTEVTTQRSRPGCGELHHSTGVPRTTRSPTGLGR